MKFNFDTIFWLVVPIVASLVIGSWFFWWSYGMGVADLVAYGVSPNAERGQIGDKFGALNTLFTGLAFVGLVASLVFERHERRKAEAQVTRSLEYSMQAAAAAAEQVAVAVDAARLQVLPILIGVQKERIKSLTAMAEARESLERNHTFEQWVGTQIQHHKDLVKNCAQQIVELENLPVLPESADNRASALRIRDQTRALKTRERDESIQSVTELTILGEYLSDLRKTYARMAKQGFYTKAKPDHSRE